MGLWLEALTARPERLTARQGDRIVGLAFLMVRGQRRHGVMPVRTLYLNQTGDEDLDVVTIEYNDILAERGLEDEVRAACLAALIARGEIAGRRFEEIALRGLHERLAGKIAALGRPVRELATAGSALIDLGAIRGRSESCKEQLSANSRRQVRRAIALYRERGDLVLERAATVEEALAFFDAAGALHQARWVARGRPGAFAYPFYLDFHRRLITLGHPAGVVELIRVRVGDAPIGYLYNFVYRGRVLYYFSGFRYDADNRLKPGLVTHMLAIEDHLARDSQIYDFMGGDNRYKTSLGSVGPRIVSLVIERPALRLAAERPLRQLKQAVAGRFRAADR
jgi:CelD/BcsL family acetyltransferase involved in cellulose biosynthesis